jgi:hypothetical protein
MLEYAMSRFDPNAAGLNYEIRMREGCDVQNVSYFKDYVFWLTENFGSKNLGVTYGIYPIDQSGGFSRDFMFYFKNESDFVMFCLRFGQYRSNDTIDMFGNN